MCSVVFGACVKFVDLWVCGFGVRCVDVCGFCVSCVRVDFVVGVCVAFVCGVCVWMVYNGRAHSQSVFVQQTHTLVAQTQTLLSRADNEYRSKLFPVCVRTRNEKHTKHAHTHVHTPTTKSTQTKHNIRTQRRVHVRAKTRKNTKTTFSQKKQRALMKSIHRDSGEFTTLWLM